MMSSAQSQEIVSVPQSAEESEVKESKSGLQVRKQTPELVSTERTSTASYKAPNTGKKRMKLPIDHESPPTGLLEYISSPVKYFASVFSTPAMEIQKSPPKPKYKYPEKPKVSEQKSPPKVVETMPIPAIMPTPPAAEIPAAEIKPEQPEKKVEAVQHVPKIIKKPVYKTEGKKDADPKRSSSASAKSNSKSHTTFSTKNILSEKKQPQSAFLRLPSVSPRILSASSIRVAPSTNLSYRVTSTEAEAALAKQLRQPKKKVFKEWNKSPNNSSRRHASPSADRRDDLMHYMPLHAIEISRH